MIRVVRAVVAAAVLVTGLGACGDAGDTSEDRLLAALAATELLSRRLEYVVDDGTEIGVTVTIEDDYRYASELFLDDEVVYREVVYDDALAAQLLDAAAAPLLGESPEVATTITPGGWLVDELGAPPSVLPTQRKGDDPIVDALSYLTYVREAARASTVTKFDEDALDYRPDEDPFPHPGNGEIRYDVLPTRLPDRAAIERAGGTDVPELSDLRKLAVYVRDGQVVAVREAIDVAPFAGTLRRALDTGDADEDELLEAVNDLRESIGQQPIVPRITTLLVEDRGDDLTVALPEGTPATLLLHAGDVVAAPSE